MPKRHDPARDRAAFLVALEDFANVTLAAAEAGCSRSWICAQKKRIPLFAAQWDEALARGKARLRTHNLRLPKGKTVSLQGRRLAVSGELDGKRLQVSAAREGQWSPGGEKAFLDWLRATCNVRAACRATGLRAGTAYAQRRRRAAFRQAWDQAIEDGRVHLEMALIASATNLIEGQDPDYPQDVPEVAGMDAGLALKLLAHLRPAGGGSGGGRRWHGKVADPEMARASILRKVAAIRAAKSRK